MGFNKQAKQQIKESKLERGKFERKIEGFKYGQQREGLTNPYEAAAAGLTNRFSGLRVDTRSAEFERQGTSQNIANIADALRQGGGGSTGATQLARLSAQSNQQITAGLTKQQQNIQQLQAQGAQNVDALRAKLTGAGEQYILGLSEARDVGELAGLGARYAGAQQGINTGYQSIAATNAAAIGFAGDVVKAGAEVGGAAIAASAASDPSLKENVTKVGESPSGIPVYEFNYKGKEGRYRGAMSTEVPQHAVLKGAFDGYDGVDYSKIDVNFEKL